MNRIKNAVMGILPFAVLGGLLWLSYKSVVFIYHVFTSLNPNVVVAIIAGVATVLASTLAVVVTRYFQAKADKEAAHRDRKIDLYDEIISKLYSIFLGDTKKETNPELLTPFLREAQRKLILWAGPGALTTYSDWSKALTSAPAPCASQMIITIELILALREDVGLSNAGIKHSHMVRFFLKHSDFFMEQYRKNKDITFQEISELEKAAGLSQQ